MNILILYFSGTGNTELISKELSQRFELKGYNVELVSLEDEEKIRNLELKDKIVGFGFPVYKFTYPDIFNKYLEIINKKAQNNNCFLFSTFARFNADSFSELMRKLDKKSFYIIAAEGFKSPSCGISARKDETDFEYKSVMFFEDNIHLKLDSFVDKIIWQLSAPKSKKAFMYNPLSGLKLKIIEDIEKTKYPKLQIDRAKCSLCFLCVKKCPENNFLTQGNHVDIIDDKNCLHCLRCMNHCPSNSISFGRLTIGENRYTLKKRNELFERAISGYKEKYWQNFNTICTEWRKKTIKYWWQNRKDTEGKKNMQEHINHCES